MLAMLIDRSPGEYLSDTYRHTAIKQALMQYYKPQAEHSGQHPRNLGAILHGHSGMLAPPPRGAPDPIRTAP